MNKKILSVMLLIFLLSPLFSEDLRTKFIKGNIADKTAAVKEASGEESLWLSRTAVDFVLTYKELIGSDKEIDGLAVAAILSYPNELLKDCSNNQKKIFTNQMNDLFNKFKDSSIVQIAVISKVLLTDKFMDFSSFTVLLNNYISAYNVKVIDAGVMKSIINALGIIGDNDSFIILYNFWKNSNYDSYTSELESSLVALSPRSVTEILKIIAYDVTDFNCVYKLIEKNTGISKNSLCEIAENVLSESILYIKDSSKINPDVISTQMNALKILNDNKWTKSSKVVAYYFEESKRLYDDDLLAEKQFTTIIESLSNISPTDSVASLILYLEELNKQKEKQSAVSNAVVLSVIKTLGAIGDKSAFDSLLSVTYLRYSESILSAAREALSGLRW